MLNVKLAGAKEMVRKTRRSFVLVFFVIFFFFALGFSLSHFERFRLWRFVKMKREKYLSGSG